MHSISKRILLVLFVIVLIFPSLLLAATEQRIALVIGNSSYSSGPLKNPVNDATDMAAALQKLGFKVNLKKNANLETMEEAIEDFGNRLKKGGVGLFYYAGHGVQVNGVNYLIPIGAKVNKESDVRYKAVNAGQILDEMANANNGLNIVILDACRDNPFGKSFRSTSRGLAIVSNSPSGTFISYSTSPGHVANDGEGKNSPYTKALLENISKPGLTINDVFMNVRSKVKKQTGQLPWELSSLEGRFFFVPGSSKMAVDGTESKPSTKDALDDESRKLEDEELKLENEKALLEKKKALAEKRQIIEAEKAALEAKEKEQSQAKKSTIATVSPSASSELDDAILKEKRETLRQWAEEINYMRPKLSKEALQNVESRYLEKKAEYDRLVLVMGKRPSASTANEIKRNGRLIAYDNGTVLDTQTNLMWAAKDNGSDINLEDAKSYCKNYRGGGYTDWRIPTQDELVGLYESKNELIKLTNSYIWSFYPSLSADIGDQLQFNYSGKLSGVRRVKGSNWLARVLPVRSAK
jgi:uncharacterized caspase-like protein